MNRIIIGYSWKNEVRTKKETPTELSLGWGPVVVYESWLLSPLRFCRVGYAALGKRGGPYFRLARPSALPAPFVVFALVRNLYMPTGAEAERTSVQQIRVLEHAGSFALPAIYDSSSMPLSEFSCGAARGARNLLWDTTEDVAVLAVHLRVVGTLFGVIPPTSALGAPHAVFHGTEAKAEFRKRRAITCEVRKPVFLCDVGGAIFARFGEYPASISLETHERMVRLVHFLKCGIRAAGIGMEFFAPPLVCRFEYIGSEGGREAEVSFCLLGCVLKHVNEQTVFGVHRGMPPQLA